MSRTISRFTVEDIFDVIFPTQEPSTLFSPDASTLFKNTHHSIELVEVGILIKSDFRDDSIFLSSVLYTWRPMRSEMRLIHQKYILDALEIMEHCSAWKMLIMLLACQRYKLDRVHMNINKSQERNLYAAKHGLPTLRDVFSESDKCAKPVVFAQVGYLLAYHPLYSVGEHWEYLHMSYNEEKSFRHLTEG